MPLPFADMAYSHINKNNSIIFSVGTSSQRLVEKLLDEPLNVEIFGTLKEAQVLSDWWRRSYNTIRPHSSLKYRPPTPETMQP
jgi:transposase InsO family protein